TDPTGTQARPNRVGVLVAVGTQIEVGGTRREERNLISGNRLDGVTASGDGVQVMRVRNNYIGTDVTGTRQLGNGQLGVQVRGSGNQIGGDGSGEGNVISGNGDAAGADGGVAILSPVGGAPGGGNSVRGNLIGLDAGGTMAVPNGRATHQVGSGVRVHTNENQLTGNVVSGNEGAGIALIGAGAQDNFISENRIGLNAAGAAVVGNGGPGIVLGWSPGGDPPLRNIISRNSIDGNLGLGIDLGDSSGSLGNGVTPNDVDDPDTGANALQNFPVLTRVVAGVITGTLNSTPDKSFRLEFFASPDIDPSGHGEGRRFLTSLDVTTDDQGNASFSFTSPGAITPGEVISATATELEGSAQRQTSEFSRAVLATSGSTSTVVTNTNNAGDGSLRAAIEAANDLAGRQTISFNIPGAGPHVISPTTPLPPLTDFVTIDGYTQPGSRENTLEVGTNAVLRIVVNGYSLPKTANPTVPALLDVGATDGLVRGLVLQTTNTVNSSGVQSALRLGGGGRHVVAGCFIGTNPEGTAGILQNGGLEFPYDGVRVASDNVLVGGATPGARNLISGNGNGDGVFINGNDAVVENNLIGTNAAGTGRVGNGTGVRVVGGMGARIRGNVVSGNARGQGGAGVGIYSDLSGAPSDVEVTNNLIGLNAQGTGAISNALGVQVGVFEGATVSNIRIGRPGAGNTIGGNFFGRGSDRGSGIQAFVAQNAQLAALSIQGNLIGTNAAGAVLGNNGHGISLLSASDVQIGGAGAGEGNVIANNARSGVEVVVGSAPLRGLALRNPITGNSIFNNGLLGIDLAADGVTDNDAGDADAGANTLQNFPVITGVTGNVITGTLNSRPSTAYRVELFASPAADASAHGEGATFLGFRNVTTDAQGNAPFSFTATGALSGPSITATATDPAGNTSEFSRAFQGAAIQALGFSAATYTVAESGPAATITVTRSNGDTGAVTVDYATANGTATAGQDYTAVTGTLRFAAGQSTATFTVPVTDDSRDEPDETVNLRLTNPTGGAVLGPRDTAVLTLTDNDAPPTLSINSITLAEGNA
ncbi:MAG TPA: Calx-beta domain-containing protein, partial [Armatimonadota bacterium]|nr:Calx-beta domain-containing protein [Armatimonadota bacterium]